MPRKIGLIIPMYNEEKRLGESNILARYNDFLRGIYNDDFSILAVINGCTDRTVEVVAAEAAKYPAVKYIEIKERGKGAAIIAGLNALDSEIVAYVDADGAIRPEEFGKLLKHIDEADIVIGSRRLRGSILAPPPSLLRRLNSLLSSWMVQMVCGLGVKDPFCGIKIMRQEVVKNIMPYLKVKGYAIDVNILYAAKRLGFKITELPIRWSSIGGSKLNIIKSNWNYLLDLFRIKNGYCRRIPEINRTTGT